MLVNSHSIDPRSHAEDGNQPDTKQAARQQDNGNAGRTTNRMPAAANGKPASRARNGSTLAPRKAVTHGLNRSMATDADHTTLLNNVKQMLATSQIDAWNRVSDCIRGSVEYDLGHDRRSLDKSAEAVRTAEREFNDAEHQMTTGADPFSGLPWPADYAKYENAKQQLAHAKQAYDDEEKSWNEASHKHLSNVHPYVPDSFTLDADNRLTRGNVDKSADWVVSATDARELSLKAAQYARDKIDLLLGKAWEQSVLDLRAWREQNIGKIDAETISRQLNKTAETHLLLEQDAALKKSIIDTRVKNFNDALDKNQAAVITRLPASGSADKSEIVGLLRERKGALENAISDANDQVKLACALMTATVNDSRLATPRSVDPPYTSSGKYQGSPDDYAGRLSFYDTSTGKDVLVGTKDLGVTTLSASRQDTARTPPPDFIAPPPLTPAGTHLKLAYSYERLASESYPQQNSIVFTTQQTHPQTQAEKDFVKYGGPTAALVRAGEYGYVRFNNSQLVKEKLPTLSQRQKPMLPFHQPIPAAVQFATRGVSIASDFTRGAMYVDSAARKLAQGEDPTLDYVAAGAALAQGTIDSSIGLYVDAALVSASQYKADHPQAKLPGKVGQSRGGAESVRGISYEYRPDGSLAASERIDPDTGELQQHAPLRDEFAVRDVTGDATPSTSGTTSPASSVENIRPVATPIADIEVQTGIDESARRIVQSAGRVAQAYQPLSTRGVPWVNTSRARLNALATELQENANQLKSSFQKFSFNVELNRANVWGGKNWSIPGGVKLMGYASAGLLVPALAEYGIKLSSYIEKAKQGKGSTAADAELAASTINTAAMITPYIPAVGPVVTPFLLLTGIVANAVAGSLDKTPVEKVAAQLRSQTAHPLANLGGYDPIVRPAPPT
ncbi:hypothetical protein [Paraburkholderia rhizosphaerae]|uniref:Uncharacterized protein n=1 Tax=Paraburkholderia rhizosphaerae TaxID=480658 RepID=A0A4R8M0N6_9BURK|nr:hypothetical protein [Paraburkholderia rhizosphaerae]TDY54835.1 hypothetical protein BX592_101291 [Paraburkholderia rhizosphaerae]